MIRARIILEPHGEKPLSRVLAEITVINIGGNGRVSSDYAWRIRYIDAGRTEITVYGCLCDSHNSTAIELLCEVLAEWQSGRRQPIDHHGHPVTIIMDHEAYWRQADPVSEPLT